METDNVIGLERKVHTLEDSKEFWNKYILYEEANYNPNNEYEINWKSCFENDRFRSLEDISKWIDENPQFNNIYGNTEVIVGKKGVLLELQPQTDKKHLYFYFKDEFWGNGGWYNMDNTVDIYVFLHVFSKLVNSLNPEEINNLNKESEKQD